MKTKTHIKSVCSINVEREQRAIDMAIEAILKYPQAFICTWEELFEGTPSGAFKWDCEEAGDWVPSVDEDKVERWVNYADACNIGRHNDGTEWVEFLTVDVDGNWDVESYIEKKPKQPLAPYDLREYEHTSAMRCCYYVLLKQAKYSLHVAQTGDDPLGNTIGDNDPAEVHSRQLAHDIPDLTSAVYGSILNYLEAKDGNESKD